MKKDLAIAMSMYFVFFGMIFANPILADDVYSYYLPYCVEGANKWTGLGLRASGDASQSANVSVIIYDQNGEILKTQDRVIRGGGQDAFVIETDNSQNEGWIRVNSDRPLSGCCFFGSTGYHSYMADITLISELSEKLYVPHIGQNYQWDSKIMVCNPHDGDTTVTLTFVDKEGNALSPKKYTISPNGSGIYEVADLVGDTEYVNGSVEISATRGIAAFALYDDLKWQDGVSFAGISAVKNQNKYTSDGLHTYYFPYFTEGSNKWTGVGLRNLSDVREAQISAVVYDKNGRADRPVEKILAPRGQDAFVLEAGSSRKGWIQVKSNQLLAGCCFFGTSGYNSHMADITLIPELSKALHVPHIGQNYEWDSEILICNPNDSSTTVTLTFADRQGDSLGPRVHTIPANGSGVYEVADLVGDTEYVNGSVEISATQGIAAFALYDNLKWNDGMSFAGISAIGVQADTDSDGDGFTENDGDCNDYNPDIHPDAAEHCEDGIDQNCDGRDSVCSSIDRDDDGDGFTENDGDCNDSNSHIRPGAEEICEDGIDQDCNGGDLKCPPEDVDDDADGFTENQGDCNDDDADIHPDAEEICGDDVDQNCDNDLRCPADVDDDGDGFTENQGDCDDSDAMAYPNAREICEDKIDQNCDGKDMDCPPDMNMSDDDRDGFSENMGDCDDNNPDIYPRAPDICGDGIDQDCNGSDRECPPEDMDDDGDGHTENQGDCDDGNASVHPGAEEICEDGIDQDCSGGDLPCPRDEDGDGFAETQGDCDDGNASVNPGAEEICGDGIDQDCNGSDPECPEDKDSDGYTALTGDCNDDDAAVHPGAEDICEDGIDQDCSGSDMICSQDNTDNDGDGYTENQGDCNDSNPFVHPGAEEICEDGIDQDCDNSDSPCTLADEDNDGDRFSERQGDCNDADNTIYPRAAEICGDGIDQDCNGSDSSCPETETDDDGDGFTENQGDCDDESPLVHPGASEICRDGIDQDCDGDDLLSGCAPDDTDDDGDGFTENQGDCNDYNSHIHPNAAEICGDSTDQNCNGTDCDPDDRDTDDDGDGYTENQGDCNDDDVAVHPDAREICGDNIDQNCKDGDSDCMPDEDTDDDGDGFTENQGDCDDGNAGAFPGSAEICGDNIDQNCNGTDLACDSDNTDDDGDGFTENQGDCNDRDMTVHPGASEICGDDLDQDCDGLDISCAVRITESPNTELAWVFETEIGETLMGLKDENSIPGNILMMNGGAVILSTGQSLIYWLGDGRLPKFAVTEGWIFDFSYYNHNTDKVDIIAKAPEGTFHKYFGARLNLDRLVEFSVSAVNDVQMIADIADIVSCVVADTAGLATAACSLVKGVLPQGMPPLLEEARQCNINDSYCEDIWLEGLDRTVTDAGNLLYGYYDDMRDDDGDGFSELDGDCNDGNFSIRPGGDELCDDDLDNNCDGVVDEADCLDPLMPVAILSADPLSGEMPLSVSLDAGQSHAPAGEIVSYVWTSSDGQIIEKSGTAPKITDKIIMAFNDPGTYTVVLTITDSTGRKSTAPEVSIIVMP